MTATSLDGRAMLSTRPGILLIGYSPAPTTMRASKTQSVCGVAQQVRIRPAASSASDSALGWCAPWITRPSLSLLLHEPQAPPRQPEGGAAAARGGAPRAGSVRG